MNRDELLLAQLEDKINQATDRYMVVAGDFLDTHQRKIAEDFCKSKKLSVRIFFYGGYEDAERCMPFFLPDYIDLSPKREEEHACRQGQEGGNEHNDCPSSKIIVPEEITEMLRIIRVSAPKGSRKLTHRDYLGSILALGINREVTGDILVRDGSEDCQLGIGADIIVQAEIADFIELNYDKAGHTNLTATVLPISRICVGKLNIVQKHDTVASLRLDNIVSSAFALSRAKAAEAIRRGIVSVNSIEALKVDMEIREGDKIVVRGRGKAVLSEIGGTSRKDRTRVTFNLYQ